MFTFQTIKGCKIPNSKPYLKPLFYAHSNGEDVQSWQLLFDHLAGTARIAEAFGASNGLSDLAYCAGLFHDLGKYSDAFQQKLRGHGSFVDHSTAGAQEIVQAFVTHAQPVLGKLLAYTIAGHHSGLPDFGSILDVETESTLCGRLKRKVEPYEHYKNEFQNLNLTAASFPLLKPSTPSGGFTLAFMVRMLYSMLVDADFIETETYMTGGKSRGIFPSILELRKVFNKYLEANSFPSTPVNQLRSEIFQNSIEAAKLPRGLFSMTVPTGGGKTLSSMGFALQHAALNNLKRIIYVIPYTSIIEQNAAVFKNIFSKAFVLEYHSNFDWEDSGKPEAGENADFSVMEKQRLASENWDIPIIVTTNVQFFESLFASRSSRNRKVHNIGNSVIIFDEAQMLPQGFLKPCVLAIAELVLNYGSSAVLCTATQPELQRFFPSKLPVVEIMKDPSSLYDEFKRVTIHDLGRISDEELISSISRYDQALCVVNTRKHARHLFDGLAQEGRYHLSTLMYANHRKEVIQQVRDALSENRTCRLISTQLIEAGVDIDFPVGFRALAGLDSIIQTGGRVNRNRRFQESDLFVFEPVTESIKKLPLHIAQAGDVTRQILRDWKDKDPISLAAIRDYYLRLYNLQAENTAFDINEIIACFEKPGLTEPAFDFRKASEAFKLICDDTVGIIIPLEEEMKHLLFELRSAVFPLDILRKIQPYTVNVYRHELEKLIDNSMVEVIDKIYFVLKDPDKNYDAEIGLLIPAEEISEDTRIKM